MVNQTFDYFIPERFQEMLRPGMRVIIPFGPRKITGFVIERIEESEFEHLKSLIDVLDVTPVLTEELLRLGKWLADETLSLYIMTYQAMLPQVLKAKYKKIVMKTKDKQISPLLETYFANKESLDFDEVIELIGYRTLQTYVENGDVQIHYQVKSQETKRYQTMITPASIETLQAALEALPKNATKQKEKNQSFIHKHEPNEQAVLYRTLQVNRSQLKRLMEKKLVTEKKQEMYRNPYDKDFPKTENLTLTEEQQAAITPIFEAMDAEASIAFYWIDVTGNENTEIYLKEFNYFKEKGEDEIELIQEIVLTP